MFNKKCWHSIWQPMNLLKLSTRLLCMGQTVYQKGMEAVSTIKSLAYWGLNKITNSCRWNESSWMKVTVPWFEFHWSLFLALVIQFMMSQYWFRHFHGTEQTTCHYLNQWLPALNSQCLDGMPKLYFLRHHWWDDFADWHLFIFV